MGGQGIAVVIGATGGIGAAVAERLEAGGGFFDRTGEPLPF